MTAYVISEVRVPDETLAQRYRDLAATSIARYGGRYLVRGTIPGVPEGAWDDQRRLVIVEFPTSEQLREWYTSPEYAVALQIREQALDRRLLFAEGLPPS
ncbi:DUF1330 domain-containing protein [Nocardia vaccinii]|uniref:DUF1330 domain-containing protein n=1 Tax=Nocardia vaccinii TaxID=1822 RepID=UPI00082E6876|nr:DUF1330 domain-containing protein [Nocardia vaccinii]